MVNSQSDDSTGLAGPMRGQKTSHNKHGGLAMSQTPGYYQELTTISPVTDVWKLTTWDWGNRRERADTVIS